MIEYKQSQNGIPTGGSNLTITGATAVSLQDAIRAAIGGGSTYSIPLDCDAIDIIVTSGSVQIFSNEDTPTTTTGNTYSATGNIAGNTFYGTSAKDIKLLETTGAGSASVFVRIGKIVR